MDYLYERATTLIAEHVFVGCSEVPILSRSNGWSGSLRFGDAGEPRTLPGVM